jgi:hypothetical protein
MAMAPAAATTVAIIFKRMEPSLVATQSIPFDFLFYCTISATMH